MYGSEFKGLVELAAESSDFNWMHVDFQTLRLLTFWGPETEDPGFQDLYWGPPYLWKLPKLILILNANHSLDEISKIWGPLQQPHY